jgi:hypothetical protein
MTDPREFQSFDDAPTNDGWKDRDYDEIRPRSLRFNDDEIDEEPEGFEGSFNDENEGI